MTSEAVVDLKKTDGASYQKWYLSEKIGKADINVIVPWDNAPASNKGYIHKCIDILDTNKNRIIVSLILEYGFTEFISDARAAQFTQSLFTSDNDPALWRGKFGSVDPAKILAIDPEARRMIYEYLSCQIQLPLIGCHESLFTCTQADHPRI